MTRLIEVRLKDKTTDEYVDVVPEPQRPGRVFGILVHRHERNADGSLDVYQETLSADYSRYRGDFRNFETEGERLIAHYIPGQFTSFRETDRDLRDVELEEPN